MAIENNQIRTRIQLKSDTQANWEKVPNFVPLDGEIIVYTDINSAKIGDGETPISTLPFIDAGSINGKKVEIVKLSKLAEAPQIGSEDKIYITLDTNMIYHYNSSNNQYEKLYEPKVEPLNDFIFFSGGFPSSITVQNHILQFNKGVSPTFTITPGTTIITKVGKEPIQTEASP